MWFCICVIVGIIQFSDTKSRMYFGQADGIQIEFSTYSDYEQFVNAKSPSIIIYNDKTEFESIPDILYISGCLKLSTDFLINVNLEEYEYKLEFITKNGRSFTTTPMIYDETIDKGIKNFPFIAYCDKHDDLTKVVFKTSETELFQINVSK